MGWLDDIEKSQNGKTKKRFMQPTDDYLPNVYNEDTKESNSEVSMSIGGENGEPAYMIPSFKYGRWLDDPRAEFNKTGEHLGGPFKTWQEAEKFGKLRHEYVERGEDMPAPIPRRNMQNGSKIPIAQKGIKEYEDFPVVQQLDEVTITGKGRYPYYNTLTEEQKSYWNDSGVIGSGVKRQAMYGKGDSMASDTKDMVKGLLIDTPLSGLQVPQSTMVEGIEAIQGNDYSFGDAFQFDKQRLPSDTFLKDASPGWQLAGDMLLDPEILVGLPALVQTAIKSAAKPKQVLKILKSIPEVTKKLKPSKVIKEVEELYKPSIGVTKTLNSTPSVTPKIKQDLPLIEDTGVGTTLQLKSTMANNPKGLHTQVTKKGMINTENALKFIKNNEGQAKYDIVRKGFDEKLPKNMPYTEFKNKVSNQLVPLNSKVSPVSSSYYGTDRIGYKEKNLEEAGKRINDIEIIQAKIDKFEWYKNNPDAFKKDFPEGDLKVLDRNITLRKAKIKEYKDDISKFSEGIENKSIILNNRNEFGYGDALHIDDNSTLAHINYIIDDAYPETMRVTQLQSDWAQHSGKGSSKEYLEFMIPGTEKRMADQQAAARSAIEVKPGSWEIPGDKQLLSTRVKDEMISGKDYSEILELQKGSLKNYEQKGLLQKNISERILQESIDEASKRGLKKMQIPTAETAAKIQNYEKVFKVSPETEKSLSKMESLRKGLKTWGEARTNLRAKVRDDATKLKIDEISGHMDGIREELEILKTSIPKVYDETSTTILKKYSNNPKILKKLGIDSKTTTDKSGHSWYEFEIPESFSKQKGEIKAFQQGGTISKQGNKWLDNMQDGGNVPIAQNNLKVYKGKSKDNTNVVTKDRKVMPFRINPTNMSARQAEKANQDAFKLSSAQAKQETIEQGVKENYDEVSDSFLWNLPGMVSPVAAEDLIIGGIGKAALPYIKKGVVKAGKAYFKAADKRTINKATKLLKDRVKYNIELFSNKEGRKRLTALGHDPDEVIKTLANTKQTIITKKGPSSYHAGKSPMRDSEIAYNPFNNKNRMSRWNQTPEATIDHEIGHFLQNISNNPKLYNSEARSWLLENAAGKGINTKKFFPTRKTIIDKELANLPTKKDLEGEALGALNYWNTGSNGLEKLPFLREMRTEMLNKGVIKHEYDKISPKMLNEFINGNPKNRLASIVNRMGLRTFSILSDNINKLPVITAGVVGAKAATSSTDQESFQNGGWLDNMQSGGVIEDDRGQWAHPGEVTKINSNDITMKGVKYPVLGISDTGDKQMMMPGEDYKFKGNSVTEYPMAQNGHTEKLDEVNVKGLSRKTLMNKYKDSLDNYNYGLKTQQDQRKWADSISKARNIDPKDLITFNDEDKDILNYWNSNGVDPIKTRDLIAPSTGKTMFSRIFGGQTVEELAFNTAEYYKKPTKPTFIKNEPMQMHKTITPINRKRVNNVETDTRGVNTSDEYEQDINTQPPHLKKYMPFNLSGYRVEGEVWGDNATKREGATELKHEARDAWLEEQQEELENKRSKRKIKKTISQDGGWLDNL